LLLHTVEADNLREEHLSHCLRRIRMSKQDEVAILTESVHHGEDDRFPVHARQSFDEVHTDVRPNSRWYE
jgi:hypothetical protein